MDDSTFTIVALTGVVVLFVSGVTLIWIGLRGRSERLPQGADDILDAIDAGLLASKEDLPPDDAVDLRDPDGSRAVPRVADAENEREIDQEEDDTVTRAFFAREPELERF